MTISVYYLLRRQEGFEPVGRFARACARTNTSERDLVIALKGFGERIDSAYQFLKIFEDRGYSYQHVLSRAQIVDPDNSYYDLGSYWELGRRAQSEVLVFLNTFSEPLVPGWLDKLVEPLKCASIGMTSCTGSYESFYTNSMYGPRTLKRKLLEIGLSWVFFPMPNFHLRTNAFALRKSDLVRMRVPRFRHKFECHLFESGKYGLGLYFHRNGFDRVVVSTRGYHKCSTWPESRTFRAGDQEYLMVADNRTREYDQASPEKKSSLSFRTWGRVI